jgi:hypothetical protein
VVVSEVADDRLPTGLCLGEVAKVLAAAHEGVSSEPTAFD